MPIYDVSSYQIFCVMTLKELSEPPVRASEEDLKTIYVNGVSEAIFIKVGMCLPAGPYVTDDDVKYIVDTIKASVE